MAKKKQELTVEEKLAAALVREDEWPYEVPGNWVWTYLTKGYADCLDRYRKPINATERSNRNGEVPYYGATGQWVVFSSYCSSDFIPVEEGKVYRRSDLYGTTLWDADKNFIMEVTGTIVPTPPGTAFVKLAIKLVDVATMMFTVQTEYPDYYVPHTLSDVDGTWDIYDGKSTRKKIKEIEIQK